jgi:hypothetical protein
LSGCRLKDGEYLILVSAVFCEKPHEEYRKRWGIEMRQSQPVKMI